MNIDTIRQLYNDKKEVHFKLYSLEYTIKQDNDFVIIYADLYSNKKNRYLSVEEMFNNFTVYNESLIDNQDRITNIN